MSIREVCASGLISLFQNWKLFKLLIDFLFPLASTIKSRAELGPPVAAATGPAPHSVRQAPTARTRRDGGESWQPAPFTRCPVMTQC